MRTGHAIFLGGLVIAVAVLDVLEILPSGSASAAVLFAPALAVAGRGRSACGVRRA